MSPPAVAERIARLESVGVIEGYRVQLNHPLLGRSLTVVIGISSEHGDGQRELAKQVLEIPEVERVDLVTGPVDLQVRLQVRDQVHLNEVYFDRLLTLPGIRHTDTALVLHSFTPAELRRARPAQRDQTEPGGAMSTTGGVPHFSIEAQGSPTRPGRYVTVGDLDPVEFVPGLEFRPVLGENAMANFVTFAQDTEAPLHVHEEEQITIVLDGEFEFTLDGETRTMRAGDVAVIPPWVPHGAHTNDTTCDEIDVFTPPRASLLDHARKQRGRRD
jgi:DNA-binding Lrp family transcriptional regulator/quercetin dioxygenase-like cupin family protein